jgi:small-conductance mechanosensitive channel
VTLHNTIITGSAVIGILLVGWLILTVVKRRLPEKAADIVSQLTPAVALSVIVIGVLIILDPDQAEIIAEAAVRYVPNLLTAVLVVILARAAGKIVGVFIEAALRSASPVLAARARMVLTGVILAVGVIIALDQLGVSTDIIMLLVAALAFGVALAGGLAVGLGALPVARQVAAGRHVQDRYDVGQRLRVGAVEGTLVSIGLSTSRLSGPDGVVHAVPNETFLTTSVAVLPED